MLTLRRSPLRWISGVRAAAGPNPAGSYMRRHKTHKTQQREVVDGFFEGLHTAQSYTEQHLFSTQRSSPPTLESSHSTHRSHRGRLQKKYCRTHKEMPALPTPTEDPPLPKIRHT